MWVGSASQPPLVYEGVSERPLEGSLGPGAVLEKRYVIAVHLSLFTWMYMRSSRRVWGFDQPVCCKFFINILKKQNEFKPWTTKPNHPQPSHSPRYCTISSIPSIPNSSVQLRLLNNNTLSSLLRRLSQGAGWRCGDLGVDMPELSGSTVCSQRGLMVLLFRRDTLRNSPSARHWLIITQIVNVSPLSLWCSAPFVPALWFADSQWSRCKTLIKV